jgi:hypothetical protein
LHDYSKNSQKHILPIPEKMEITRSWREQKVMLKRRFANLSDSDFEYKDGKRESMLDKLSTKLKKSRAELESLFAELQTY